MTVLALSDIDRDIGGGRRLVVDRLELAPATTSVLYGPNGAGKTSLVRILAGTLPGGPDVPVAYLPQRPYVFRGPARRSLLLGLDEEGGGRALELAERLGVTAVLDRRAAELSGGERRRLGLARALAGAEQVVALDEPFAEIDVADRAAVRATVADAIGERTAVVVTHDRDDAAAMGDRLVVLVDGTVRQTGVVTEVLALPADEVVAGVLGAANLLPGTVRERSDRLLALEAGFGTVWGMGDATVEGPAVAVFGAETVTVYRGHDARTGSARNRWAGTVAATRPVGRLIEVEVEVGPARLVALLTPGSADALDLQSGAEVTLAAKATAVRVIPR